MPGFIIAIIVAAVIITIIFMALSGRKKNKGIVGENAAGTTSTKPLPDTRPGAGNTTQPPQANQPGSKPDKGPDNSGNATMSPGRQG